MQAFVSSLSVLIRSIESIYWMIHTIAKGFNLRKMNVVNEIWLAN